MHVFSKVALAGVLRRVAETSIHDKANISGRVGLLLIRLLVNGGRMFRLSNIALALLLAWVGLHAEAADPMKTFDVVVPLRKPLTGDDIDRFQKELNFSSFRVLSAPEVGVGRIELPSEKDLEGVLAQMAKDSRVRASPVLPDAAEPLIYEKSDSLPKEVEDTLKKNYFGERVRTITLLKASTLKQQLVLGLDALLGGRVVAVRRFIETDLSAKEGFRWSGDIYRRISLEPNAATVPVGTVSLSISDGKVYGRLTLNSRAFVITSLGQNDLYALVEIDARKIPSDHPPKYKAKREGGTGAQAKKKVADSATDTAKAATTSKKKNEKIAYGCTPDPRTKNTTFGCVLDPAEAVPIGTPGPVISDTPSSGMPGRSTPSSIPQSRTEIRIAVGISDSAKEFLRHSPEGWTPTGFVKALFDGTNDAYERSSVSIKILPHDNPIEFPTFKETDAETDLEHLENCSDGVLDNACTVRVGPKGASLFVLIVSSGNSACGVASRVMATKDEGFAIVRADCALANLSFAHEIGHLLGANHNPDVDDPDGPCVDFGRGHFEQGKWRTIMSYDVGCNCPRVPYWSNPNLSLDDRPLGLADRNNASCLNENGSKVRDLGK